MNDIREFTSTINPYKKLKLDKDNRFIIYEKTQLPLEYISTENIGKTKVYSKIDNIPVAGRDVLKLIKYRTEGRDLNIVFLYDGYIYKFNHIQYSNYEFK
jgi:hypothetical protein